ncbi:MAG: deoxyribonuclease IV [Blastocatellia bacterium]|jgi:deoxyribonuclease-4
MMAETGTRQPPRLGLHTGIAGGLHRSIERAVAGGCQTWQIFSRNPRGWTARPLDEESVRLFREARLLSGLDPCVIHSCYLINLAAPAGEVRARSIAAFRDEVERSLAIGADYLVIHPGSAREITADEGIENCAAALHAATSGLESAMVRGGLQILIENTAGQGGQIGRSFAEVAEIVDRCPDLPMGMCLDTAHSFAAGYDWRDEQASDAAFQDLDRMVGFDRIRVVHFNDSKAAFQSRVDRHWHIGTGEIGPAGLARILNHPRLGGRPFILETPQDEPGDDLRNLAAARSLAV